MAFRQAVNVTNIVNQMTEADKETIVEGGGGKVSWPPGFHLIGTSPERYYGLGRIGNSNTSQSAFTIGIMYFVPFYTGQGGTIDRIAIRVTTLAASGVARAGIYLNDGPDSPYPATLLLDGGEVSTATTGNKIQTVSQILPKNTLCWGCVLTGVASPSLANIAVDTYAILGARTSDFLTNGTHWSVPQAYGALPATAPAMAGATLIEQPTPPPLVAVRYSA